MFYGIFSLLIYFIYSINSVYINPNLPFHPTLPYPLGMYVPFILHNNICVFISSVQSLSRVRFFVTPWTAAYQASLSITNSQSLLKLMFSLVSITLLEFGVFYCCFNKLLGLFNICIIFLLFTSQ